MNKRKIIEIAIRAGFPTGWYQGPWFDEKGNFRTGVPDCLIRFVELIQAEKK